MFGLVHHAICGVSLGTVIVNHVDVTECLGVLLGGKWSFVLTNRAGHCRSAKRRPEKGEKRQQWTLRLNHSSRTWQKVCWQVLGSYLWERLERFLVGQEFDVLSKMFFFFCLAKGGRGLHRKRNFSRWPPTPHCLRGIGCQPPFVYLPLTLSLSLRSFCVSQHFAWKWQSARITQFEGLYTGYCSLGADFDSRQNWRHGFRF